MSYRTTLKYMDKSLLAFMIIYSIIGLIMILSASSVSSVLRYGVEPTYFFTRQGIILLIGYLIGFLFILKNSTKRYKAFSLLYVLLTGLGLVYVSLSGTIAGGAKSWISLGFFNLQPSEFFKIAVVIYMATFYEKTIKQNRNIAYYLIPIIPAVVGFCLTFLQPDFGGALIIAFITFMTFVHVPFPKKVTKFVNWTKIITIVGVAIMALVLILRPDLFYQSQIERLNFVNPCSRYDAGSNSTGYQVCNGFIAYHNGGLFGRGLGNSTQKYLYLPEAHTDFIFPILVEELGFIVGAIVLIGYFAILMLILNAAKKADSIRNSTICYGIFAYLIIHLILNLMGGLALIPLTGVPLPFLSYGGSYNLNIIICMFIVLRITAETKYNNEKRKLASL